ncbi:DUF3572 domain-containing protein [uncultured Litoreibacter sp.]|uniref:DUF3572 domain-containing protein n=1 Tax=uncultured Litoreibacter sp. TaxID=1392394 RepID=UPI00262D6FAE|nr:DUF3572 domain-containing protein [uncultured Litoreibacter sp.]
MNPDAAQSLALQALTWILSTDDLAGVFMGSTGTSADDMRAQATDPAYLGSVLDFLLMDDAWITGFCDGAGFDYMDPMRARQLLPGGDLPNWT